MREIKGPANESCRIRFRYDIRLNRNIESRLIAAASRLVSKKMKFLFTSWSLVGLSRSREGEYIFSFYFPLQNSFRSTVDRGIHGQVPLGGRVFQRSELRHSIETNFVSQLIATCLGSDENNA